MRNLFAVALGAVTCGAWACASSPSVTAPMSAEGGIGSDAALFGLVTQTQPFAAYTRFPNLAAAADGVLTASSAHQPFIRVSLNATAAAALQNGRLPAGASFPDGSIVFKEVLTFDRVPTVYAVMYKDRANALAGNGWLWAEYRPNGSVGFSITNRGDACTSCHALEQGSQNDLVRSFERQR